MINFEDISKDIITYVWCYVNTENEFLFIDTVFIIDDVVDGYKVYNKADNNDDYTNKSLMEEVLVILDSDFRVLFYDQNYEQIPNKYISIKR